MSRTRRTFQRIAQTLSIGPASPAPATSRAQAAPGDRSGLGTRRTLPAYLLAVVIPLAVGVLLIPFRDALTQSISLLMILPVVVVAVLGGARPAVVAAVSAAVTFDVLHTEPYYRFTIHSGDEVVELIVLLLVGVAIGLITEYAHRSVVAARVRRRELEVLTTFARATTSSASDDELIERGRHSVEQLLSLRSCEWRPGYHGTVGAVLRGDGTLSSGPGGLSADTDDTEAATLPTLVELPLGSPPDERGRFILHADPAVDVSIEERRAAAVVAELLDRRLDRP